jgi:hypothetical protein
MSYEYHQLQMVVLLPKETAGLAECEKELRDFQPLEVAALEIVQVVRFVQVRRR